MSSSRNAKFRFVNYSGTYQLQLKTAEDLSAIPLLDEPFWMATSAPTHQLRCDPKFLEFMDQNSDGRILSRDVRRTLEWMLKRLSCLDGVTTYSEVFQLDHINGKTPEGRQVLVTARRILQNLQKPDAECISLAEARNHQTCHADGFFGGNGVIPLDSIEEKKLKQFLSDIADTMGSVPDVNGNPGIDQAKLDAFLLCAEELLAWKKKAEDTGKKRISLFPLGEATSTGYKLLSQLRDPVNQHFRLCRLMALNRMLDQPMPDSPCPADILDDARQIDAFMAAAPVAPLTPEGILDLHGNLNPAFQESLKAVETQVVAPILGDAWESGRLSESDWTRANSAFTSYEDWLKSKSGGEVEKLGPEKLHTYLESDLPDRVRKIAARDQEIGKELVAAQDLEYLILLQQWFLELCNNFVSFHNLYDPEKSALFEAGHLVISGRVFNLNIPVRDPNAHSRVAKESGIFLLYSEVTGANPEEKFFIVTPVTALVVRRLGVDRRGVFFDRDGREWDARVIKIIDNPVSLKQAILRPFTRLGEVVSSSFEKMVSGTEKQLDTSLSKGIGQAESSLKQGMTQTQPADAPVPPPAKTSGARDWVLTGSIAVAALGTSFAFIAKTLTALNWQSVSIAILIGLAIVLIPIILIADYKLHKRNLGSLLEASGWAINTEMRLSRNLAKILTPKPCHPAGFIHIRRDLTRIFLRRRKI